MAIRPVRAQDGTPDDMPDRAGKDLPAGVELYHLRPDGGILLADREGSRELGPEREFLRFIDDGQFAHYLVGDAATSPERPSNATVKLGVVGPRSAFTPHAHGGEHFVLSLGHAACGLYDGVRGRVTDVPLAPGMLIRIPEMMPHSFANRGDSPLTILAANTGYGIDHEDYAITAAVSCSAASRATSAERPRAARRPVSSASSASGSSRSSRFSWASAAFSESRWVETETYSPAAIDIDPASSPARPAVSSAAWDSVAPATPTTRPAVETTPSLAPSTAARSQLRREPRPPPWASSCSGASVTRGASVTPGASHPAGHQTRTDPPGAKAGLVAPAGTSLRGSAISSTAGPWTAARESRYGRSKP